MRAGKGGEAAVKSRTVYRTVLTPLLLLLVVEAFFLVGSLVLSGVAQRLDQNARDLVNQQTENRRNYLEASMVRDWSGLSMLAQEINAATLRLSQEGTVDLEALDGSSDACAPLLLEVVDEMISTLYAKRVTGVFLVFNTHPLPQERVDCPGKTGIYIRDQDPNSAPSARRADLLLERAPIAVVRALNISTDSGWQPLFTFDAQEERAYDFFWRPYQAAVQAQELSAPSDYGYWSAVPFTLQGSSQSSITYSIPLILPDGTVYGVLGVDLLTEYLHTALPHEELSEGGQGSYLLAVSNGTGEYTVNLASGPAQQYLNPGDVLELEAGEGQDARLLLGGRYCHAREAEFVLYNSNTPFEQERWALVGLVPEGELYAFSRQMRLYLYLAILAAIVSGALGSLLISRRVARPIRRLSQEVELAQRTQGGIPQLSRTGMSEIDSFSQAFTALSREAVDTSTKFLRIMEMASVEIGGFELRRGEERFFVTDNFFPLFGQEVEVGHMTASEFRVRLEELYNTVEHSKTEEGDVLFQVRLPRGESRYLRVEAAGDEERYVGLVEDVTAATKERLRIERERDYDLLTGLCSRRAFYRQAQELFQDPECLGHGALVMLDLDNLKQINDRFGHDWGDQYIRRAGQCFAAAVPPGTLCARVSGDEFYLLFTGYGDREEIRALLPALGAAIRACVFDLPSGERVPISASGGVAWYPEDSGELSALMRYADFAMYQVKKKQKGRLGEFDLGVYNRENYLIQRRREFHRLVARELVSYHFQPIVSAATGAVAAYEALMRVELPTLHSPLEVLAMAKAEGKLGEIERLTWNKSLETYQSLLEQGLVEEEALIFVNSIASQSMPPEEIQRIHQRHGNLQSRVVIELTESEDMDEAATRAKRDAPGFSGSFALDDYGSGYNSEKNLLMLSPKYIKVDNSIIRDIDTDGDKQGIVANIVGYAHERDMLIVAEGLETAQELEQVLELGVDLLQGYFPARPGQPPPGVSPQAREMIQRFHRKRAGDEG